MHTRGPGRRKCAAIVIALFSVGLMTASIAWAGPGGGMGGGSAGGGGGSSGKRGGGGSGGNKPKEPPKKRNQQTVEPTAAREKLATALEKALVAGSAGTPFLIKLFDDASTGALPASTGARKELAEAISTSFKGKKLTAEHAKPIAEAVAAGVNIDGFSADDLTAKKTALSDALGATDLTDDQKTPIVTAWDKVVSQQQDEAIKKVATDLGAIQAEGSVSEDQKKSLNAGLTALASGDAKPDDTSITKLVDHLAKGLDNAQLLNKERAQLAHDFQAVFNSAAVAPADFQSTLTDVKTILKAGVVPAADQQLIATDLQAIHQSLSAKK